MMKLSERRARKAQLKREQRPVSTTPKMSPEFAALILQQDAYDVCLEVPAGEIIRQARAARGETL